MNTLAIPELKSLPPMIYRDMPVATSEMLARFYGADPRNIRDNYQRNKERFQESKHVFTVTGGDLQDFRSCAAECGSPFKPGATATKVHLWTLRGAARHAKMLNTERAWTVFEEMEDCYFNRMRSEPIPAQAALPLSPPPEEALTVSEFEALLRKKIVLTGAEYLALRPSASHHAKAPLSCFRPICGPAPPRLTLAEKRLIKELAHAGRNGTEIAAHLGRNPSTIQRFMQARHLGARRPIIRKGGD